MADEKIHRPRNRASVLRVCAVLKEISSCGRSSPPGAIGLALRGPLGFLAHSTMPLIDRYYPPFKALFHKACSRGGRGPARYTDINPFDSPRHPRSGPPTLLRGVVLFMATIPALHAGALGGYTVDSDNLDQVRQFHLAIQGLSEDVPLDWSGSYTAGGWGGVSESSQAAVLRRVNYYRALAGVPAEITFDPARSAQCQQAALMLSANKKLSHNPPPSWWLYTAAGAEAAGNSNLAIGTAGSAAVTGYMCDPGAENTAAGHRWWLLYPNTRTLGNGDIGGLGSYPPANALWVNDGAAGFFPNTMRSNQISQGTRFVSWPPVGYVPYEQIFARWSFMAENADLRQATVSMQYNGLELGVRLEFRPTQAGHNSFLVWVPQLEGVDTDDPWYRVPRPYSVSTARYQVTISNVLVGGVARSIQYTVTAFDPAVPGLNANATVKAPLSNRTGSRSTFSITPPKFTNAGGAFAMESHDARVLRRSLMTGIDDAENGLGRLTARVSGYDPIGVGGANGSGKAYVLGHGYAGNPTVTQYLELDPLVVPSSSSILNFSSRLGVATKDQIARVQVSTNDGVTWSDIWLAVGNSQIVAAPEIPAPTQTDFQAAAVKLDTYAGRTIRLRFAYTAGRTWYRYTGNGSEAAWQIDNIRCTNSNSSTKTYVAEPTESLERVSTQFVARIPEGEVLVQARGRSFGDHPLEWGRTTLLSTTPDNGSAFNDYPDTGSGWRLTPYGWAYDAQWPHVFFINQGYAIVQPVDGPRLVYLYDYGLQSWMYVTETLHPWYYCYRTRDYLFYASGTATPQRWYYSHKQQQWIREGSF